MGKKVRKDEGFFGLDAGEEPLHLVGDGDRLVVDFADDEFLREAAKDDVEGIPKLDAADGLQRAFVEFGGEGRDVALHQVLLAADDGGELSGGFLKFLVLKELVYEFPTRIDIVIGAGVGVDGVKPFGEQQPTLYLHQRGGHDKKLAGDVEVERLHRPECLQVLFRDRFDRDVIDVDLALPDEKKQEIERAFKDLKLDAVVGIGNHGAKRFGRRRGAANENGAMGARLLAAQGGDEEAVGVVLRGQNGEAAGGGIGGEAKRADGGRELGLERRIRGEKSANHVFVFKMAERAGGVNKLAAGADQGGVSVEEVELLVGGRGDLRRRGGPLEVGRATPSAGSAARGVDEDAVVKGGGSGGQDRDVGETGAGGANLEFFERACADIVGVDVAGGAEDRGELERFAAGAGAGVQPAAAGWNCGRGKNHLRAEVLDLNEAAQKGIGFGDVGVGEQLDGAGEGG